MEFPYAIYDDDGCIFNLSRPAWSALETIEKQFGFFHRIHSAIVMKCGKCNSFTLDCKDLFYALVPFPESVLNFNFPSQGLSEDSACCLSDEIWALLNIMTEEKITTNEEWIKFQDNQMPEKRLLYTQSGDFIFPEEGYPLGLVYEEAYFKIDEICESCDAHIR